MLQGRAWTGCCPGGADVGFAERSKHEVVLVLYNRTAWRAVETSVQKRAEGHRQIPRSGGEPQGQTRVVLPPGPRYMQKEGPRRRPRAALPETVGMTICTPFPLPTTLQLCTPALHTCQAQSTLP